MNLPYSIPHTYKKYQRLIHSKEHQLDTYQMNCSVVFSKGHHLNGISFTCNSAIFLSTNYTLIGCITTLNEPKVKALETVFLLQRKHTAPPKSRTTRIKECKDRSPSTAIVRNLFSSKPQHFHDWCLQIPITHPQWVSIRQRKNLHN